MKILPFLTILSIVMVNCSNAGNNKKDMMAQNINLVDFSQQLLYAAKTRENTDSFVIVLASVSATQLKTALINDDFKKAFWINVYNAYTQIILSKNRDKYKNRSSFFSDKQIKIASKKVSLDDIEHGILRRSKAKLSLGYLNKLFPSSFEKANRVETVDYRIHFALNCGAKSCPPIAFYKPEQLNTQLDNATNSYLKGEAEYDEGKNTVAVPALMNWFRADFGGEKAVTALLKKLQIVPGDKHPEIKYKTYDWNLFLENYK